MTTPSAAGTIKACLFDLDGVLVDTARYHFKAWRRLANELGIDFTENQNEQLKGISRIESLNKILSWGKLEKTTEEKELLATQKNDWYVEMISGMTPAEVLPGTLPFLREVKAAGYRIALGSASKNAGLILKKTMLDTFFDALVDGNMVSKSKPDPEVFLTGALLLAVSPQECVVFEDALAGIEAAHNGGMKTIGIGDPALLQTADRVVANLGELTVKDLEQFNRL